MKRMEEEEKIELRLKKYDLYYEISLISLWIVEFKRS